MDSHSHRPWTPRPQPRPLSETGDCLKLGGFAGFLDLIQTIAIKAKFVWERLWKPEKYGSHMYYDSRHFNRINNSINANINDEKATCQHTTDHTDALLLDQPGQWLHSGHEVPPVHPRRPAGQQSELERRASTPDDRRAASTAPQRTHTYEARWRLWSLYSFHRLVSPEHTDSLV